MIALPPLAIPWFLVHSAFSVKGEQHGQILEVSQALSSTLLQFLGHTLRGPNTLITNTDDKPDMFQRLLKPLPTKRQRLHCFL